MYILTVERDGGLNVYSLQEHRWLAAQWHVLIKSCINNLISLLILYIRPFLTRDTGPPHWDTLVLSERKELLKLA